MPYDNRNLYSSHITDLPNYDQQVRAYRTFLKSIHQQPHVAVVDESYREPERVKGQTQQGFYALTATIVRNENFPILRERFLDITSYWHTTEAAKTKFARRAKFNSGNWEGNILPMMKVAHAHVETNLVTVHAKIPYVPGAKALNHHVENARKECITTMTKVLTRDPRVPVSAVIFEGRRDGTENYRDRETLRTLKNTGIIGDNFKYTFTSSSIEPVLWAADLGAWATQRFVRYDDSTWLQKSQLQVHWFDAQSGHQISPIMHSMRPQYTELGRIQRDIEAGENLEEHLATLEKAVQGLLDNKIYTGRPDTPALRGLSWAITQQSISAQQAHDLEIGRGEKSSPQQMAIRLLRTIENKIEEGQNPENSSAEAQNLQQKVHELKQQAVQRHQRINESSKTEDMTNLPKHGQPAPRQPQRGTTLE